VYRSLPVPADLAPDPGDAGPLEPLRPALAAAARACCWYWLGRGSDVAPDGVRTTFEGPRPLRVDLLPLPGPHAAQADEVQEEEALFAWAAAAADPLRDDAVHQATGFAVRDAGDLPGAAGHVLRTARSLHELAGRGAVAEALAARRSARDAAITAARSAAAAAREVAGKAVERSVALLVAVALALFANGSKLLGTGAAALVVAGAAALALAALAVATLVEIRSGEGLLQAFDTDAGLYREALGEDDLRAIRGLAAVSAARDDLSRARTTAKAVYLTVAAAIALVGLVVLAGPVPGQGNQDGPAGAAPGTATPTVSISTGSVPSPTETP
jgi:hypothetical protein